MTEVASAPLTADVLRRALEKQDLVRLPATLADYDRLSDYREFSLHFVQNQIVVTMSYATENHELLVSNLLRLLGNAFEEAKVLGSNRPVYIAEVEEIFEPDIQLIFGETELYRYGRVKNATKNPVILVEVHSATTEDFDLNEKLTAYKTIPSLQHIVFVQQYRPYISLYTRSPKTDVWLNTQYADLTQSISILDADFLLSKIYKKVIFNLK